MWLRYHLILNIYQPNLLSLTGSWYLVGARNLALVHHNVNIAIKCLMIYFYRLIVPTETFIYIYSLYVLLALTKIKWIPHWLATVGGRGGESQRFLGYIIATTCSVASKLTGIWGSTDWIPKAVTRRGRLRYWSYLIFVKEKSFDL